MVYTPVVSVHDGLVELSLDVTAARVAVGWRVRNDSGVPVEADLTVNGNRLITVPFAPGEHTGAIPRNRQWNIDDEGVGRSYGLAVRW